MRELRAISTRAAISRTSVDDGSGRLSSLMGLRADVAGGDERALYLAWLLDVQWGVIDDDAIEPSRPEGLGRLSPALASFVDLFGLDGDLVAAAASGDSTAPPEPSPSDIERWLAGLSPDEHVAWLSRVARGEGGVGAEIMRRLRQHTRDARTRRRIAPGRHRAQTCSARLTSDSTRSPISPTSHATSTRSPASRGCACTMSTRATRRRP
jgi:hypothetical protein